MNFIIADDDSEDRSFLVSAFSHLNAKINFTEVDDGEILLTKLNDRNREKPDLIICDLNMPKISGWDLLHMLKNDHRFTNIPVVIFSTSSSDYELMKSVKLGASAFYTKPFDYDGYLEIARSILSEHKASAVA